MKLLQGETVMDQNLYLFMIEKDISHPFRATNRSAGLDLSAPVSFSILPGALQKINLGVCVKIPSGFYGRLEVRSSLAAKGIVLTGGVIDEDYVGPLYAVLINLSPETIFIRKHDRIVQLICEKCLIPNLVFIHEAFQEATTERGISGFGSSGI